MSLRLQEREPPCPAGTPGPSVPSLQKSHGDNSLESAKRLSHPDWTKPSPRRWGTRVERGSRVFAEILGPVFALDGVHSAPRSRLGHLGVQDAQGAAVLT